MELVLGHVGDPPSGELHLMEWFIIGVVVGFILGGMFAIWVGQQVERNLRIPKSQAATILQKMTEEEVEHNQVLAKASK